MGKDSHSFQVNAAAASICSILMAISLSVMSVPFHRVQAAVTLVYFRAIAQNGRVLLEWETATQLDTVGFYINRSLSQSSGYTRMGNFVVSQGDPLTGATYSVTDSGLTNGITYWYKLESIDTSQNSTFYDPPASATPGSVYTNTPTPTLTAQSGSLLTGTATATRTQTPVPGGSKTPTKTRTLVVQATGTIGFSTPTATLVAQATGALTPSPSTSVDITDTQNLFVTATTTLIPMPEVTLDFPTLTSIYTPTSTPVPSFREKITWFTPGRVLLIGIVLILWIILGGWFFHTFRQLE